MRKDPIEQSKDQKSLSSIDQSKEVKGLLNQFQGLGISDQAKESKANTNNKSKNNSSNNQDKKTPSVNNQNKDPNKEKVPYTRDLGIQRSTDKWKVPYSRDEEKQRFIDRLIDSPDITSPRLHDSGTPRTR